MNKSKRIVVKIGSSLLVDDERLVPKYAFMHGFMADVADLRKEGYEVVITSSGAVALGLSVIGKSPENAGVLDKQAAAACGQPLILNAYKQVALEYGFDIAQILVTMDDMEGRRRFLNAKNTVQRLFERGVVPIVNENDTITTEEIKVGDNDRLAAKMAQMIQADHFVILTCVDGLYDKNPSEEGAKLVETVEDVSEYLEVTSEVSALGSGGMLTKMQAANMAQNAGCTTLIGRGQIDRPISSLLDGSRPHTKCIAKGDPASSWAVWLTNRLQVAGSLVLNNEGVKSVVKDSSGVAANHIVSLQGDFQNGDVLHMFTEDGEEIARGITNYSSEEVMILAHHPAESAVELLGYKTEQDIISRDNLVVLEAHHLNWDVPTEDVRQIAS